MNQIMILTLISLLGAVVGIYFLEGAPLRTTLLLIGGTSWYVFTFSWWAEILLDKFIK